MSVHTREQRLIALLALQGAKPRSYLAGMLWPDSTEARASGNLRAAVCKIDRAAPGLIDHQRSGLAFTGSIRVDVDDLAACADRICGWARVDAGTQRLRSPDLLAALSQLVGGELLPGWYDDWVLFERARLQQKRIRALEIVAEMLLDRAALAGAALAASAAVTMEPLRESAQRVLIRVHLRQGNPHLALRDYQAFRTRMLAELGVPPSPQLDAIVRPLLDRQSISAGRRRWHPKVAIV